MILKDAWNILLESVPFLENRSLNLMVSRGLYIESAELYALYGLSLQLNSNLFHILLCPEHFKVVNHPKTVY
jgi:hypothetical protein